MKRIGLQETTIGRLERDTVLAMGMETPDTVIAIGVRRVFFLKNDEKG